MSEMHLFPEIRQENSENVVLGKHKTIVNGGKNETGNGQEPPAKRRAILGMLTNVPGHRMTTGKLVGDTYQSTILN